MKISKFLLFTIILISINSCSVELKSVLHDSTKAQSGVVYNLPKNLIKCEITYSLREGFELVNGVETKLKSKPIVTIEKPIVVSSMLTADDEKAYLLVGDRITNSFFTKSTLDFNLAQNGILSTIDADIEDQSIEFAEKVIISSANLAKTFVAPQSEIAAILSSELNTLMTQAMTATAETEQEELAAKIQTVLSQILSLDFDAKLLTQIIVLNEEYVQNQNKDSLLILSTKINYLKSQIEWFQKRNKTFYKVKELKYSVVLDPFEIYQGNVISTSQTGKTFSHQVIPAHLFPSSLTSSDIPTVKISIINRVTTNPTLSGEINGVVVRHPASTKIDLEVDNNLYASEVVFLAQLGNISILPVKSKKGGKVKTSIKFDSTTGALTQHKIEASSGSEKVGKSIQKSTEVLKETVDYLNFEKEIKRLEAIKKEGTLSNEIYDLNSQELSRKVDALTQEQKILELETKIEQMSKENPDVSEFETKLRELEQQKKLLELQQQIKALEEQISNIGNN